MIVTLLSAPRIIWFGETAITLYVRRHHGAGDDPVVARRCEYIGDEEVKNNKKSTHDGEAG